MENNNWRPSIPNREPVMDTGDWRNQLPQQLTSQQSSLHEQPLGSQSNVAGLQQPQQQLLSSHVGNSSLQSVHMLSQPTAGLQRTHQAGHGLFPFQGQQSQNQPSQQQMMPSYSMAQAGSGNGNGIDWQEEVFQKIKTLKDAYLSALIEIEQVVAATMRRTSLPQELGPELLERFKQFKTMLERMILFLAVPKSKIMPALKDKVAVYERQIIHAINSYTKYKPLQQRKLPQSQPMQQQSSQDGNLAINKGDWRTLHTPASRQKNVNTLLETLKKHVPYSGEEGIEELMRIAVSFEELIFNTARNQLDYVWKLSLKVQSMEEGS